MISNRCARKSLVTNCNSIISKNYLRFLVDSNDLIRKKLSTMQIDCTALRYICACIIKYIRDGKIYK